MPQFNLDKLPEQKADALSRLLFPTKRETAENHSIYFYSAKENSWFCFNASVPENVKAEICNILRRYQ